MQYPHKRSLSIVYSFREVFVNVTKIDCDGCFVSSYRHLWLWGIDSRVPWFDLGREEIDWKRLWSWSCDRLTERLSSELHIIRHVLNSPCVGFCLGQFKQIYALYLGLDNHSTDRFIRSFSSDPSLADDFHTRQWHHQLESSFYPCILELYTRCHTDWDVASPKRLACWYDRDERCFNGHGGVRWQFHSVCNKRWVDRSTEVKWSLHRDCCWARVRMAVCTGCMCLRSRIGPLTLGTVHLPTYEHENFDEVLQLHDRFCRMEKRVRCPQAATVFHEQLHLRTLDHALWQQFDAAFVL